MTKLYAVVINFDEQHCDGPYRHLDEAIRQAVKIRQESQLVSTLAQVYAYNPRTHRLAKYSTFTDYAPIRRMS